MEAIADSDARRSSYFQAFLKVCRKGDLEDVRRLGNEVCTTECLVDDAWCEQVVPYDPDAPDALFSDYHNPTRHLEKGEVLECITPMTVAVTQGHLAVVQYLCEEWPAEGEISPLFETSMGIRMHAFAASCGHVSVYDYLVKMGGFSHHRGGANDTEDGTVVLSAAIMSGSRAMVQHILNCGVDPKQRVSGPTSMAPPLDMAVILDDVETLSQLLELGCDPNVALEWDGRLLLPLHEAIGFGNWRATDVLMRHGADPTLDANNPLVTGCTMAATAHIWLHHKPEEERRKCACVIDIHQKGLEAAVLWRAPSDLLCWLMTARGANPLDALSALKKQEHNSGFLALEDITTLIQQACRAWRPSDHECRGPNFRAMVGVVMWVERQLRLQRELPELPKELWWAVISQARWSDYDRFTPVVAY